ncbi:MAG TPA: UDP-N-acetylglucosamine pyrophosphorylase [Fibrobacteres bacterium]|nr:UDP-N-acetylglucosamine pyrophosphorylase [Fibrobacterota bacterium]
MDIAGVKLILKLVPNPHDLDRLRSLTARHGQEHLLRFWDALDAAQRAQLAQDIGAIDFDLMARLHRDLLQNPSPIHTSEKIKPLEGSSLTSATRASMTEAGMKALREGKAAAFLVAGGQGTRLGHEGPKGTFDIGLPSGKSLFQLQAERLLKLSKDCGKTVPWYIMTSRDNHAATTAFFEVNHFFGLNRNDVMFFSQAELPVLDSNGKVLLAEKGRVSLGPNGNGGCFPALKSSGALEDMKRRGVEWVFTYSVDNALVKVCDPAFIGFTLASNLPAASKAVAKSGPSERVGVFCLRNDGPSVIEYSEMTPEMCAEKNAQGRLVYGAGNVAMHLFRRDFLEAHADSSLPYHLARKKIPYVDTLGNVVSPTEPNASKFELFMFDLFPQAPGMAVLEVERTEEFAPVKNPTTAGVDSPATARKLMLDLHRRWASSAGFSEQELEGVEVEVSPLASYAGEGLNRASFHRDTSRPLLKA